MLSKAIVNTDTETLIKSAAKNVFLKKGLAGTRMQEIANLAGIGRTALHYYFRRKEKLFQVVLKEAFRDLAKRTEMLRNSSYTTLEKMEAFVDGYFDKALAEPEIDIFMLNEFNNNPGVMRAILISEANGSPFDMLLNGIETSVKKGEMKGAPKQILITLISMCVFSFAGRGIIQNVLFLSDEQYMVLMKERKIYMKDFLKIAFKP
ncbi:TetR/AcrR family transcriptional regulator [Pedobacter rhodius]|uniref:TetR/AcrR family transcriptional regulator n=1 Tax=Pedobacter rhodius TaxID=3004098 RepID=A0ABT4KX02_9SPHI|nr:TetR/AcrR family transcriptional regulator [Pedobacter sp. SJ11]MCZ4223458.1 TetR/AcrR family transcriptional regulator [Pedobacter sp. SJ11]